MADCEEATYYFAYGSNMAAPDMAATVPALKPVGRARAANRRLAFNRRSRTWGAGAADICPEPELTVWGRLFRFDGAPDWEALDRKEGAHSGAYERQRIDVERLHPDGSRSVLYAYTYTVPEAGRPSLEICPSPEYLAQLMLGAAEAELPPEYLQFLAWLAAEAKTFADTKCFRDGLLALPTVAETGAGAGPLLMLNSEDATQLNVRSRAVVSLRGRPWTLARASSRTRDPRPGTCRVDQNIRHVLTHRQSETYGYNLKVAPATDKSTALSRLLRPRVVLLPVSDQAVSDSEKGIAILSTENLELLGLTVGDRVTVTAVTQDAADSHQTVSKSLRTFTGSADTLKHVGREVYPGSHEICLDREARLELGAQLGDPVWVRASVTDLFWGRLLYYALAAIGIFFSFNQFSMQLFTAVGVGGRLALAIGFGTLLIVVIAYLDLRHKVQA